MVQNVMASLGESADRKFNEVAETSRQKLDEIKKKNMEDLYRDTTGWVRSNPGKTLITALAAGFVIGWLFRRR
jgi:ElaB/YqjD/DUF883 family membrane-anchored ribosome-binding protein